MINIIIHFLYPTDRKITKDFYLFIHVRTHYCNLFFFCLLFPANPVNIRVQVLPIFDIWFSQFTMNKSCYRISKTTILFAHSKYHKYEYWH
jgi:hypothetical protein